MKEKKMKKSGIILRMLCIFALLMMLASTQTVQARDLVESGKYTYTVEKNYSSSMWKSRIYSQETEGSKQELITINGIADLQFIYNGNLYYEATNIKDETVIDLWALDLQTGETKKVVSNETVQAQYGAYVVLMPNTGVSMPLTCTVYNLKTGKSKVISKNCFEATISGKKIYYAQTFGRSSGWTYKTRIYCCSLSGTKKKAVSKYFTADYCYELTSKYVRYHRNGKNRKLTF